MKQKQTKKRNNNKKQKPKRGVMNVPLKFLTARKILPFLDLLAKFKRMLARSPQIFALLASSQSKFFISAPARKKIAVLGMLANARKCSQRPFVTPQKG